VGQGGVNASLFDDPPAASPLLSDLELCLPPLEGEPAVVAAAEALRGAFVASFEQLRSEVPGSAEEPDSAFHPLASELQALRSLLASTRSATWWTLVPRRHGADVRRYLRCRAKCSEALDLLEAAPGPPPPRS